MTGFLQCGIRLGGMIVLEASLPSFSHKHQQVSKNNKRYNPNQQKVFLKKVHRLRIVLIHKRIIDDVMS